MSEQIQNLTVATPAQIVEAWQGGVMHNTNPRDYAQQVMRMHPVPADMSDPTFYTPEGNEIVWHQARDISNVGAMRQLKEYLASRGLALPAEVGAAWARIMERQQWAANVRLAFEEVMAELVEAEDLIGTVDLLDRVGRGLLARVE